MNDNIIVAVEQVVADAAVALAILKKARKHTDGGDTYRRALSTALKRTSESVNLARKVLEKPSD